MECPYCHHRNPENSNFCLKCGHKQEQECPQCGQKLPPSARFCNECGHELKSRVDVKSRGLSVAEKFDKIQRYLPEGLVEKVLSQRSRIEGEHRQVTIMFCDMKGFTPLAEQLGPDETFNLIDKVFELLIHKVNDYQGTVNELRGDGILAFFGAPVALEDAPQRAIRSALAIQREMTRFNSSIRKQWEIEPILLRIGINTGPVIVGTVGNDLRVQFTAVGDTINTAARMEAMADPGAIFVTEETFKLTEGFFRFEALGPMEIKGKEKQMDIYRVIAPSSRRTRFDVSAEQGLTPFAGRERDLELIIDSFRRCMTGRGQAISVISEAGGGKSRLIYEFRKSIANEDVTFLEGKCLSYSTNLAYHPIIDILKSNFDITDDDSEMTIIKKVKRGIEQLGIATSEIAPYLLDLLLVKDSGVDKNIMSPEEIKICILNALKTIVVKGSEIRPLIITIEDLHWLDKNSKDSLNELLENISGSRVLLLFTYRPEFILTWDFKSYHGQVNLNRLSERDSLSIAKHLLGSDQVGKDLEYLILDKTEGVPFFIEEFVKSLRDLKIIEKRNNKFVLAKNTSTVSIPATIQDVIMARIDTLTEEAKRLLQVGAVIGREFKYEIIQKVADMPADELRSCSTGLKNSELIYERGIYPDSTYIFKHALTRDVAYDSLLLKIRKDFHCRIASAIEDLYFERLEEYCEILAHHSLQGEDWLSAYKYNREAGLRAMSLSDYETTRSYFRSALAALENLPANRDRIQKEIGLRFNMRSALFPLGRHKEWGKWIDGVEPLAIEINDEISLSNAYHLLSTFHWIKGEHRLAIEVGEKALDLARKCNNLDFQLATLFHLGGYHFTGGNYNKSILIQQQVLDNLTEDFSAGRVGLAAFPSVVSRCFQVLSYSELGNYSEAVKIGQKALKIAKDINQTFSLINIYGFYAACFLASGQIDSSFPLIEKGWELCRQVKAKSLYAFTAAVLAYAYILRNEPGKALEALQEGADENTLNASWCGAVYPLTVLGEAHLLNGDLSLAYETMSRAIRLAEEREEKGWHAWAKLIMAKIQLARDEFALAKELCSAGEKQAMELGMLPLNAHFHRKLGQIYHHQGQKAQSMIETKKAEETYRELGMTYWLDSLS